jgi:TolB protein
VRTLRSLPVLVGVLVAATAVPGGGDARQEARPSSPLLALSADRNGQADVFVLAAATGQARDVSNGPGSDQGPVWAPDGRSLLFVSDRTGNYDIWRVRPNGAGLTRLTSDPNDDSAPAWSPDGRSIVYRSYQGRSASYDLYVMRADGSGRRALATNLSDDVAPSWSSDGRRIVFVRSCTEPELCMHFARFRRDGGGAVYVMPSSGGRERRLTGRAVVASDPRWSPDGHEIVFVSARPATRKRGAISTVYVVRPDGSGLQPLAEGADPQWSPDGRRIAFTTTRAGHADIELMNADGSGHRALTRGGDDGSPRWSPNGRQIFFTAAAGGREEVFEMNADGSGRRRVSRIDAAYGDLAVAPRD